jgi:hypothetical protein
MVRSSCSVWPVIADPTVAWLAARGAFKHVQRKKLQHRHRAIVTTDFTSSFSEGDRKLSYGTPQAVGNVWWYQQLSYVKNILLPARY